MATPKLEQIPEEPELDPSPKLESKAEMESWRQWTPVVVSACVSLAVSAATIWFGMQRFCQQQRQMLAMTRQEQYREVEHAAAASSLHWQAMVDASSSAIDLLTWPTVRSFLVVGTPARPQARARIFVDGVRGKCAIYATGLPEMPPAHSYELWFTTADGKRVPAGTFEATRDGNGSYITDLPLDGDQVTEVSVSLEPTQGSAQPTSNLLIRGRVK